LPDLRQALKAFVLVNHTEAAQHDRGQEEVLALCRRNPAITEPEAIYQLQDALKCLSLRDEEGPKLWERAVTAKQNDKDLYIRWLNQAVADSNWLSAQKV
jgi:N-terminal acetyltransferase B complex non-catalytic subunit